ncbi:hypothetical protein [Kitasatospora sp. NPDC058218]|uniref:hypothetical protein n=1 Tax=Kitasatospora sp. NPDC058218 TaxID=3346385 RepID=UPI0036D956FF
MAVLGEFFVEKSHESKKAQKLQESIDQRIVELLTQDGFEGPRYDRFVDELVRYGIAVLRAWMYSGFIFQLVAKRGFGLNPHELELEELHSDTELRDQLATMTIARALPRFREQAFVEGGWRFDGGASITTYFMGACAYDFPNEFRRWKTSEERQARALGREKALYEKPVRTVSVADEVIGNLRVLTDIEEIDNPTTRAAVALTIDGFSQEEIRELLDAKSVRAIEGRLHRWRTKAKQEERGERG